MSSWQKSCKEHDEMVKNFPIGSTVVHVVTKREWKICGHLMTSLAIALSDSPHQTIGYASPNIVRLKRSASDDEVEASK